MGLFGGSSKAGKKAAAAIEEANNKAIAEQQRQFDITQKNFDPFIQAGTNALPDVIEGTSAQGLDARLAEIFNTGIFGSLVDERTRGVEGALSAGGLTRSGTAVQELSAVPQDVGLAIEQLLTDRSTNLAGNGQNAVSGLGNLGAQNSQGIAALLSQIGQAKSAGILQDAASKQGFTNSLIKLGGTAAGSYYGAR